MVHILIFISINCAALTFSCLFEVLISGGIEELNWAPPIYPHHDETSPSDAQLAHRPPLRLTIPSSSQAQSRSIDPSQ